MITADTLLIRPISADDKRPLLAGRGSRRPLDRCPGCRAREEGITSFTALVLADIEPMLKLLGDLGEVRVVSSELGTVELIVGLHESGLKHLKRVLKAVARGTMA